MHEGIARGVYKKNPERTPGIFFSIFCCENCLRNPAGVSKRIPRGIWVNCLRNSYVNYRRNFRGVSLKKKLEESPSEFVGESLREFLKLSLREILEFPARIPGSFLEKCLTMITLMQHFATASGIATWGGSNMDMRPKKRSSRTKSWRRPSWTWIRKKKRMAAWNRIILAHVPESFELQVGVVKGFLLHQHLLTADEDGRTAFQPGTSRIRSWSAGSVGRLRLPFRRWEPGTCWLSWMEFHKSSCCAYGCSKHPPATVL